MSKSTDTQTEAREIEIHSIDFVPPDQRTGHPRSLFTLWFSANAMVVTLITGAIAATTGLGLLWDSVAVLVGILVGTVFLAYHSAQGPHLGLPQMIQSRAQFGFYGANIPMVIVLLMYLGFYASGTVAAAEALNQLFSIPIPWGIVISTVLSFVLVLFGYKMIHRVGKIAMPIFILGFGLLTISLLVHWQSFSPRVNESTDFKIAPFMLILSVIAAYYITYGPYVADYSRYLPERTTIRSTFWYTYLGIAISGLWIMVLGTVCQMIFAKDDPVTGAANVAASFGGWSRVIVLIVLVLSAAYIGALNIYGGMMSSLTIGTTLVRRWRTSRLLRIGFIVPVAVIGALIAAVLSTDFLTGYENFIFFLITFLIPWSAVNLADYYFVRRGRYSVGELFSPGGRYRGLSWVGMTAYVLGCAAQVPFIDQAFYVGPVAERLGFDISWIVGIVVAGGLYMVLAHVVGVVDAAGEPVLLGKKRRVRGELSDAVDRSS